MYSDMTLLALLTGVIVPILVGLLTKLDASPALKSILNLGLTGLGTALATASEVDWNWRIFLVNFGVGWAVSIASYYGFYRPTTISTRVQTATANVGIG